ncbi:hypothetical protein BJP34_11490 [Moorena producens PAL-8-15-08-1]|uniref:Uncharacterized protein n=1 Tax=Moorena producens PAL-8-15-08-1 TaxID=1458985 RepID=A0A1D8TQZ0_9CYAN|nr:hypothetical protein BJP34_11490 [Moorena producens PAL-8-15-08-1]
MSWSLLPIPNTKKSVKFGLTPILDRILYFNFPQVQLSCTQIWITPDQLVHSDRVSQQLLESNNIPTHPSSCFILPGCSDSSYLLQL